MAVTDVSNTDRARELGEALIQRVPQMVYGPWNRGPGEIGYDIELEGGRIARVIVTVSSYGGE